MHKSYKLYLFQQDVTLFHFSLWVERQLSSNSIWILQFLILTKYLEHYWAQFKGSYPLYIWLGVPIQKAQSAFLPKYTYITIQCNEKDKYKPAAISTQHGYISWERESRVKYNTRKNWHHRKKHCNNIGKEHAGLLMYGNSVHKIIHLYKVMDGNSATMNFQLTGIVMKMWHRSNKQ